MKKKDAFQFPSFLTSQSIQSFQMNLYAEEVLYALSLSELVQLCKERQVTPLSSNPRWKKTYIPALLAAQENAVIATPDEPTVFQETVEEEPLPEASTAPENEPFSSPWEEEASLDSECLAQEHSPTNEQDTSLSPTSPVYPIVFVLVIAWVVLEIMIGAASVLVFCLKWIAQKVDKHATHRLETFRTPSTTSTSLAST